MTTVPSTGETTLTILKNVFGGPNGLLKLSEYYTNATGAYTSGVAGIPSIGNMLTLGHFRGKSKVTQLFAASYDFRDGASYPGSGNTVNDLSGNGYHLTFNSTPTYNASPPSISMSLLTLNATRSNVTIPITNNAYSIELLFRYTTNPGNFFKLFSYNPVDDGAGPQVQINSANLVYIWNNGAGWWANTALQTNKWYHVVFSSANLVYVNGVAVGTSGGPGTLTTKSAILALGDSSSLRSIQGNIALARFYNIALNASQITTLYTSAKNSNALYAI